MIHKGERRITPLFESVYGSLPKPLGAVGESRLGVKGNELSESELIIYLHVRDKAASAAATE